MVRLLLRNPKSMLKDLNEDEKTNFDCIMNDYDFMLKKFDTD